MTEFEKVSSFTDVFGVIVAMVVLGAGSFALAKGYEWYKARGRIAEVLELNRLTIRLLGETLGPAPSDATYLQIQRSDAGAARDWVVWHVAGQLCLLSDDAEFAGSRPFAKAREELLAAARSHDVSDAELAKQVRAYRERAETLTGPA